MLHLLFIKSSFDVDVNMSIILSFMYKKMSMYKMVKNLSFVKTKLIYICFIMNLKMCLWKSYENNIVVLQNMLLDMVKL